MRLIATGGFVLRVQNGAPKPYFHTKLGRLYVGDSERMLSGSLKRRFAGNVQLLLTSPPFPLNRKKRYGNRLGDDYKRWFRGLAGLFTTLLKDDGSLVIEMGNSWVPGRPVQSLLHLECLIDLVNDPSFGLRLCQQLFATTQRGYLPPLNGSRLIVSA